MTINLKKLINKLPNNEWYMRHLATSLFLIKESYNEGNDEETNFEDKFFAIMASEKLLEEELKVMEFIGNQNDPK